MIYSLLLLNDFFQEVKQTNNNVSTKPKKSNQSQEQLVTALSNKFAKLNQANLTNESINTLIE